MPNFASLINLNASNIITRLIGAIAILLIGFIVARFLSKLIHRVLKELETNKILKEQAGVQLPIEEFLSSIIKYLIYFIAIIFALNQLGLTTTVLQIILIIALVILVGFIILAFKDFIPNVVAGFLIHQKEKIKSGDMIKVDNVEGEVIHVNLTETRIKTKKKDIVFVTNSLINKDVLIKQKKK